MTGVALGERYAIVSLASPHDPKPFDCGVEALNRYLREQAGQDARRKVASVFVAEDKAGAAIHGFYTLSMASVLLDQLPGNLARKMPRYPTVPAVRLGRLAVHAEARGLGLGTHLLMDAMARALQSDIAWAIFLVDAKDAVARAFYERFGFLSFNDDPLHLYLMRKTLAPLFRD